MNNIFLELQRNDKIELDEIVFLLLLSHFFSNFSLRVENLYGKNKKLLICANYRN